MIEVLGGIAEMSAPTPADAHHISRFWVLAIVGPLAILWLSFIPKWRDVRRRRNNFIAEKSTDADWKYSKATRDYPAHVADLWEKSPPVYNYFSGRVDGYQVTMFDYWRWDGMHGRNITEVAVELRCFLPGMIVLPPFFDSRYYREPYAYLPGYEFSGAHRTLQVCSTDLEFAAAAMSPSIASLTSPMVRLSKQTRRKVGWRVSGPYIIGWVYGVIAPQDQIEIARLLIRIIESWPADLWDRFGRTEAENESAPRG